MTTIDWLFACLAGIHVVSALANGHEESFVFLREALPYAALYLAWRLTHNLFGKVSGVVLLAAICLWSCLESLIGLSQVFGHRASGHAVFGMTGSFSNPGPYGGFTAITLSVAAAYALTRRKSLSSIPEALGKAIEGGKPSMPRIRFLLLRALPLLLSIVTVALGIIVLPATRSRAGWLGFGIAMAVYALTRTKASLQVRRHKCLAAIAAVVILVGCAGVFMMKKDSALGRLHIWNMESRAIAKSPFTGHGPGYAMGAYGKAQEEYFRKARRPEIATKVAGCPEYAFNEYLKVGMETGVPGLALSLCVMVAGIAALIKRRSPFAYGLIAAAVFAFFSYPLSITQTSVLYTLLFATAGCPSRKTGKPADSLWQPISLIAITAATVMMALFLKTDYVRRKEAMAEWEGARRWNAMELYEDAVEELAPLYREMSWNFRYLYDYGYALHKTGRHGESDKVLREGAELSSDPMFHNIIGKNMEATGEYAKAEEEYYTAHYMVPCRLYPLVLLMEMHQRLGNSEKADSLRREIASMPVNPKNTTMRELQERATDSLWPTT